MPDVSAAKWVWWMRQAQMILMLGGDGGWRVEAKAC